MVSRLRTRTSRTAPTPLTFRSMYSTRMESLSLSSLSMALVFGDLSGATSLDEDLQTIVGAYFDHDSETPGLGAKIKDDPSFRAEFIGKKVNVASDPCSVSSTKIYR